MLFILYMYSFLIQSPLKKPIDLIFIHLTFVNILTIMFKLIPDLMSSFGVRHFLDDVGCKMEQHHLMAFLSVILIRDLLCVVFMMLSSIYMVNLLYKHRQRAQHVHSPNVSSQPAPEIKASHTILLLTKSKTGENDWDNSILLPNHLPICADEE
ncbi:Vomeronasal type-1 receptor 92 [Camelus dromedarius]|uniref:Vomeronasal type-1 receptor n=1 Tax=Camelus dromedarius TaxID=9838 RepID=A0A5N4DQN0_CAMDR|nr:Vomeronasal type-1 receptor 92 [Camelus dromedarius]